MEWIRTDERTPAPREKVIVKSKGGKIVKGVELFLCKNNEPSWFFPLGIRRFTPVEWCYEPEQDE
jgi:hypothetical protein